MNIRLTYFIFNTKTSQESIYGDIVCYNSRIRKAVTRHYKIIIYLWAGTCDLTIKERKFLKLKYKNNRAVDDIVDQYKRAIKIVLDNL